MVSVNHLSSADSISFIFSSDGSGATLTGTSGRDLIQSSAGNDVMNGGAGADNFVFKAVFGNDTIGDYSPGIDSLTFPSAIFADADALLAAMHDESGNAVIMHGADTLTLNVAKDQLTLHQSDLHFV